MKDLWLGINKKGIIDDIRFKFELYDFTNTIQNCELYFGEKNTNWDNYDNIYIIYFESCCIENIKNSNFFKLSKEYNLIYISEKINFGTFFDKVRILKYKKNKQNEDLSCDELYNTVVKKIIKNGSYRDDRTKTGTLSIFGNQTRFDLTNNKVPILTTKKVFYKSCLEELLWFLKGDTNSKNLEKKGVNIWKGNSSREFLDNRKLYDYPEGVIGPCFLEGTMVKTFKGYKKIEELDFSDLVYSHTGRYKNIKKIFKKEFETKIYNIKLYDQEVINCTPEHPFLCKRNKFSELEWIEAKNIKNNYFIGYKINYLEVLPFFLENYTCLELDYIYTVLALYFLKGWCLNKQVFLLMKIEELKILKGFYTIEQKYYNSVVVKLKYSDTNICFYKICSKLGEKVSFKKIPSFIENSPIRYINTFIDTLTNTRLNITNYYNVLAIQSMILKLNLFPFIIKYDNYYSIKIKKFFDKKNGFFSEGYYWSCLENISIQEKENKEVYNISVYEDESYTVNCCSVHNCYGFQWRNFNGEYDPNNPLNLQGGIDQINQVIKSIKEDPFSRRHIISNWNPSQLDQMALLPCHILIQFYVSEDIDKNKYLSCHFFQRSQDLFLGAPFNILSYALLTHIIALKTNTIAKELIMSVGDQHIYSNHLEQIKKQINKKIYTTPYILLNNEIKNKPIEDITVSDFELIGYFHNSILKGKMAI